MEQPHLSIRAILFDVYGTILEVGPPPEDADALWEKLFADWLGGPPPLSRLEFFQCTGQGVARRHLEARARGIQWPEIVWPAVVEEVIPALAHLPARKRDDFILAQMKTGRRLRLAECAADVLRRMNEDGVLLGIASNSQAYTLRELDEALGEAALNLSMFDPALRFWSFENGFSKPDPHVFQLLAARLEARGIRPAETLMVGDRFDNDIEPARACGWQTWHLGPRSPGNLSGSWRELLAWWERGEG
jgi:FMN phosphatase YigB (HAD superfamily)